MTLHPLLRPVIDFALPPRCPGCGVVVAEDHQFCALCWGKLDFLTGAGCALCNVPMPSAAVGSICGPCLAEPPRHDGVYAAVAYGDIARSMALGLKYGRKLSMGKTMAALMRRHLVRAGDGALLVPVPLHRWRLWARGFNQAATIAADLGKVTHAVYAPDLLVRRRATPSLRGLTATKRADAVRGAFRTTRKLQGERVWLIDDVYTSGATANACAATLKRADALHVHILVWARVLRQD